MGASLRKNHVREFRWQPSRQRPLRMQPLQGCGGRLLLKVEGQQCLLAIYSLPQHARANDGLKTAA